MSSKKHITVDSAALAAMCRRKHIRKLAFFGSVLTDKFRPDSDLDVLVEFEPEHVPGLTFFELEDELSEMFGRKVDLNTPDFLSKYFRAEVLNNLDVQYEA